jgi:hypothetical protein
VQQFLIIENLLGVLVITRCKAKKKKKKKKKTILTTTMLYILFSARGNLNFHPKTPPSATFLTI